MAIPIVLTPVPPIATDEAWLQHVNAKDAHVIGARLAVKAPYLLTPDRKLIAEVNQAALSSQVLTPGDFIRTRLPLHPEFRALRS